MRVDRILTAILLACLTALSPGLCAEETTPNYETAIAPIFAGKCVRCHSEQVRKGDLDLSSLAAIQRGGESGEPLLHRQLDASWLWTMLDGGGMPPAAETQLTPDELQTMRRWLEAGSPAQVALSPQEKPLTQHDVLPILLLRCTTCHGPRLQQGGVDLRTRAAMLRGGQNGPVLQPGDPEGSLLIQRMESEACPPRELLLKFFVKRPTETEMQTIRTWIAAGAPEVDTQPDIATTKPDPLVTDEDRQHWAFQPPRQNTEHRTIDEFIEAKLIPHGLDFSPEADRDTLIRRAYLDLLGMPPSPEEWQKWHSHASAGWYEEMIEHLLESPRYGERWGRYWLDVAGYADSEGGVSADPLREVAWKYRDYVIAAFNEDKPYDRFLLEQLAGDELLDYERAEKVSDEMVRNLIATGFLRMGIDQTGSRTMNFVPERLGVIGDAINVVGSGILGLTLECARCHSHKYDAIPQRDYYRFKAIFQGALDEYDWLSFKTRVLTLATPSHHERITSVNPPLVAEMKQWQKALTQATRNASLALLEHHYPELTEQDRQETLVALGKADNIRTLRQNKLVEYYLRADLLPDALQPEHVLEARRDIVEIERRIAETQEKMEPPPTIRALWDRGEPSPTYVLRRGEYDKPGPLVGPGVPSVLTDGRTPFAVAPPFPEGTAKTGRRLAFARWLVVPENPLTARVMVNRIWYHHFGTGLVASLENFGVKGTPPTHPELLDWLAVEFIRQGWSIKQMHRLIMTSRTYRQSSRATEKSQQIDPRNLLFARMNPRRMDAEALRDSLLFVSGRLDPTPGGPPDGVTADRDGLVSVNLTSRGGWRRSIYVQHRRTQMPTILETFDYPEMGPNCLVRSVSTVSPQSLLMKNNAHVHELSRSLAQRIHAQLEHAETATSDDRISLAFQLALNRLPSPAELEISRQALEEFRLAWNTDEHQALISYCHTLLNSAAFLYID